MSFQSGCAIKAGDDSIFQLHNALRKRHHKTVMRDRDF